MIQQHSDLRWTILTAWLVLATAGAVGAQEGFDFELLDEEIAAEESTAPAEPARTDASSVQSDAPDPAVVAAIRQSNPQSAADLMKAVDQLVRLEQWSPAKDYLDRLVKLSLSTDALADLYEQFGTAVMIRLARASDLAPEANDFALSVMQAGRERQQDPQQIARWIEQLSGSDRSARDLAARQLLRTGSYAVPGLVKAMAAAPASDAPIRRWAETILKKIGVDALEPLYACLSSPDASVRVSAISALALIAAPDSLPYLAAPLFAPRAGAAESSVAAEAWRRSVRGLPSREQAWVLLTEAADRAYRGDAGSAADPDDRVVRWTWSAAQQQAVVTEMRTHDAAALTAMRLYEDVLLIQPDDDQAVRRYLVSRLSVDQSLGGLDEPLRRGNGTAFAAAQRAGSFWVNEALRLAMSDGQDAAAIGAAEVLGELGDKDALRRSAVDGSADPAPLVMALSHANPRVRFAAAQAIDKLGDARDFNGAGRLADVLEFFITSRGARLAVAAHPNRTVAQTVAGELAARGITTAAVTTANDLQRATESADVELLLVSDALNEQSLWSVIEALRVHPKTARLPIAILARSTNREEADRAAETHRRVLVIPETIDKETLDVALPQLFAMFDQDQISPQRRFAQAEAAAKMLQRLTAGPESVDVDLEVRSPRLVAALAEPEMTAEMTQLLSRTQSREAQRALLDLASQHIRPLDVRKAAAAAFRRSAVSFGVLLSEAQIAAQYEIYNQSRELDRETQVLLGSILDTIEGPRQAQTSAR